MQFSVKILILFFILAGRTSVPRENTNTRKLWSDCRLQELISFEVFNTAITGLNQINVPVKKNLITIIDFSKPSTSKRFFVIDIESKQLLYSCLVAHGKNSGEDQADSFSNAPESLKSSLGFFITAETYYGTHGYSLRIEGLEKGINDNARAREIVIHGADYVSYEFIKKYGRLGRSWGCPALPQELFKAIIDKINGGTCLFIYGNDDFYKRNSVFLK